MAETLSPWKPFVRTREYRFRRIGRVVTVRAEMEAPAYYFYVYDVMYHYGMKWPEAAALVDRRLTVQMQREADAESLRWPPATPPTAPHGEPTNG